jgi:hypothetical protein
MIIYRRSIRNRARDTSYWADLIEQLFPEWHAATLPAFMRYGLADSHILQAGVTSLQLNKKRRGRSRYWEDGRTGFAITGDRAGYRLTHWRSARLLLVGSHSFTSLIEEFCPILRA